MSEVHTAQTKLAHHEALTQREAFLVRVFNLIAEPKVVRILLFTGYLSLVLGGAVTLFNTPTSIEQVFGPGIRQVLSWFFIVGGAIASIAVLPGNWWLERTGTGMLIVGTVLYEMAVIVYYFAHPDTGRMLQAANTYFMLIGLIARTYLIRGPGIAPRH